MTKRELETRIQELEQKLAVQNTVTYRISPQGAVSVYGLGRFPVIRLRRTSGSCCSSTSRS
jgi:hypothetical protein